MALLDFLKKQFKAVGELPQVIRARQQSKKREEQVKQQLREQRRKQREPQEDPIREVERGIEEIIKQPKQERIRTSTAGSTKPIADEEMGRLELDLQPQEDEVSRIERDLQQDEISKIETDISTVGTTQPTARDTGLRLDLPKTDRERRIQSTRQRAERAEEAERGFGAGTQEAIEHKDLLERIGSTVKGFTKGVSQTELLTPGFLNTVAAFEETASRALGRFAEQETPITDALFGEDFEDPIQEGAGRLAERLDELSEEDLKNARALSENVRQLSLDDPESIGQAVIMNAPNTIGALVLGGVAGATGGPGAVAPAMFAYSSALEGGFARIEAERLAEEMGKDLSEEELDKIMAKVGVANGMLETFAPARLVNRLTGSTKRIILRNVAREMIQTGIEEAGTEFLQETVNNIVQREIDPDIDLFEGSLESGVVGGISGVGFGGAGGVFTGVGQAIQEGRAGLSIQDINERINQLEQRDDLTEAEQRELEQLKQQQIPEELQPLAEEAQKFDSAEEFIQNTNFTENTELVNTESLNQFKEFDRTEEEGERFTELREDIRENGIQEPIRLNYNQSDNTVSVAEGNRRLAIAQELGINQVPVRVIVNRRTTGGVSEAPQSKEQIRNRVADESGFIPQDIKPSDIGFQGQSVENLFNQVKQQETTEGTPLLEGEQAIEGEGFFMEDKPTRTLKAETRLTRQTLNRIGEGATEGARLTKDRIQENQNILIRELMNLPIEERGKQTFITDIRDATTREKLREARDRVLEKLNEIEEAQELAAKRGRERSKIAFIRKVGEFNQTAVTDAKEQLGIEEPVSQMSLTQLKDLSAELRTRLGFKIRSGFEPQVVGEQEAQERNIPQEIYEQNKDFESNQNTIKAKFSRATKKAQEGLGDTIGIISTELKKISPKLKRAIRRHDRDVLLAKQKRKRAIEPFVRTLKKEMSNQDFKDMDLALKNGDATKINELVEKYDIQEQYDDVKEALDELFNEATSVGFDIGYRENYSPRMIKDIDGFIEFIQDTSSWSAISEAIKRKEQDLGRPLELDEKAYLINTMIRGYSGGHITLSRTGTMKERKIDIITPELNQFYYDSGTALIRYAEEVTEKIEARKFFGKNRPNDSLDDQFNNLKDSIGWFTADLLAKGDITLQEEQRLRDLLTARFSPKGTHGIVGLYKNLSYIDVMGSPLNAITQVGDLAIAMYKGGALRGLKEAVKGIPPEAINFTDIKKEDLGIDEIAQELADQNKMARAVNHVFNLIGLTKVDTLGKEALINSSIQKWQKIAENPSERDIRILKETFGEEIEGSTWEDVLDDLRSGEITENVKFLAFNELMDAQPLTLSEVPAKYVTSGNGRIFYQLKTWAIKILDLYRNDVIREASVDKVQAAKNFFRLTALLVLMNGTADELKDWIKGKKTPLKDRLIDQILTILGFSRYYVYQAQREGIGSALLDIVKPPTKLVDNIWKDGGDLYKDSDKSFKINDLRSARSIPIIGELYYWWFGRASKDIRQPDIKLNVEEQKEYVNELKQALERGDITADSFERRKDSFLDKQARIRAEDIFREMKDASKEEKREAYQNAHERVQDALDDLAQEEAEKEAKIIFNETLDADKEEKRAVYEEQSPLVQKALDELAKEEKERQKKLEELEVQEGREGVEEHSERTIIDKVFTYAKAIGTDPLEAFGKMFKGEVIRKTEGDAIIVYRMGENERVHYKFQVLEADPAGDVEMDHIIPLQLGGTNDKDNLELVSKERHRELTRVGNHLGRRLRSNDIDQETAQDLLMQFRNGELTEHEIYQKTRIK